MSLAASALLQIGSPSTQAADSNWEVDSAMLFYGEGDSRISAFEPSIHAGRDLNDSERLDLKVIIDSLTGSSPNGAHATTGVQTFTSPSGESTYTTAAGETPMDTTFSDARFAVGADWAMELDRLSKFTLGGNFSTETDYTSLGISGTFARDFNNRNTTLTAGLALNYDFVNPTGSLPVALMPMRAESVSQNKSNSSDSKLINDFLIGITQVINRKTLIQLNYSYGLTSGYQNDPYKIVSVVDSAGNLADSGFFNTVATGNLPYVYEKRPDSRQRNSLYFKTVHQLGEDVINFSYRYYTDDWDIISHTYDLKYRYQMQQSYLQPHIRFYHQTAANFHRHNLQLGTEINATNGDLQVDYASNDYRLAESETLTLGLKYGIPMKNNSELSMRAEFIQQTVTDDSNVIEAEATPDLNAIVLQVNYSLLW